MAKLGSLEEALEAFRGLSGRVGLWVERDGRPVLALEEDTPLAVASAFKLLVLAALREEVEAGRRAWDEVVRLEEAWKSLPSGLLQGWPEGSPLTLHTLAALMISLSDNTATDALIALLGRERLGPSPPATAPSSPPGRPSASPPRGTGTSWRPSATGTWRPSAGPWRP